MSKEAGKEEKENVKIEKWIYHATGRNTCKACWANDGKEFKSLKDVPTLPVHPNCNCWIEDIPVKDKTYNWSYFAKEFIRKYEGTKEYQEGKGYYRDGKFYQYQDSAGYWTIGYGHLISKDEYKNGITSDEAEKIFEKDLDNETVYANGLLANPDLTQKQFDTFLSLGYNLKKASLSGSTTLKLINQSKKEDEYGQSLEEHWKEFRKAGNKVIEGLENRRAAEWLAGNWDSFGE